jgi:hypothetical protein
MRKIVILFILFFSISCKKEKIVWNLERKNSNDFFNPNMKPYFTLDCDSISQNINAFGYGYNGKIDPAFISETFSHRGKSIGVGGFGGELKFEGDFKNNSFVTFWFIHPRDGNLYDDPNDIYIDGVKSSYTPLNVDYKNFSWDQIVQVKIENLISSGKHIIEIKTPKSSGQGSTFYIDDIEFWTIDQ